MKGPAARLSCRRTSDVVQPWSTCSSHLLHVPTLFSTVLVWMSLRMWSSEVDLLSSAVHLQTLTKGLRVTTARTSSPVSFSLELHSKTPLNSECIIFKRDVLILTNLSFTVCFNISFLLFFLHVCWCNVGSEVKLDPCVLDWSECWPFKAM